MLLRLNEPQADAGMQVAERVVRELLTGIAADPLQATAAELVRLVLGRRIRAVEQQVEELMDFEAKARAGLLSAFDADAAFSVDLDLDGPYTFVFEGLDEALRVVAGKLLVAMYQDVFRQGGFPCPGGAVLNPDSFEASFFEANPELAVCPACLSAPLHRSIVGRGKPYDIEHFFPKSAYPMLAVHHHNLVPTCMTCNERMHKAIDPLDNGERQAISATYVPYRRAAQDEITVRFQPTVAEPAQRVTLDGSCEAAKSRIRTHDRMYAVSALWGGALEHKHRSISLLVKDTAPQLDDDGVVNTLQRQARRARAQMTYVTDQLLEAEYCDWLSTRGLRAFLAELRSR